MSTEGGGLPVVIREPFNVQLLILRSRREVNSTVHR